MKKAKNYQIKKKEEIEFWYVWMIDWDWIHVCMKWCNEDFVAVFEGAIIVIIIIENISYFQVGIKHTCASVTPDALSTLEFCLSWSSVMSIIL